MLHFCGYRNLCFLNRLLIYIRILFSIQMQKEVSEYFHCIVAVFHSDVAYSA